MTLTRPRRRLIVLGATVAVLVILATVLAVWRPWVGAAQNSPCSVLDDIAFSLESTIGSGVVDASGLPVLADELQAMPGYADDPLGLRVSSAVGEVLSAESDGVAPATDAALDAVAVAQVEEDCGESP